MDRLEKFIEENREELNDLKADRSKIWAGIESRLEPHKKIIPLWKRPAIRIAASVVLLVCLLGWIFLPQMGQTKSGSFADNRLTEINMHYGEMLDYRILQVQNHEGLSLHDKEDFLSSMKELDREYDTLASELEENLDNELILEAIVRNYRQRLQLLEKFINRINRTKTERNENSIEL